MPDDGIPDFPVTLSVFGRHRSIRFFESEPLADGHLDLIMEAGRRAPTDAGGHMYSVVRISDPHLWNQRRYHGS